MLDAVAPLLHKKVPLPLADKLILGTRQVSVDVPVLFVILAVGAVVLLLITTLEVDVQPLEPVTVTV
jgi:hypothetical protein